MRLVRALVLHCLKLIIFYAAHVPAADNGVTDALLISGQQILATHPVGQQRSMGNAPTMVGPWLMTVEGLVRDLVDL